MKRYISIFCIFTLILNLFIFSIPVKADGVPIPGYNELKELQQDIENGDNRTIQDIWKVLQPIGEACGIITNPIQTIEWIRDIFDPISQDLPDYPKNGSDTDKANYITNYINNNISTNDNNNSYTINSNMKNYINSMVNQIQNRDGYIYCYGFRLTNSFSIFPSGDVYNAYRRICNQYQNDYYCLYYLSNSNPRCIFYKKSPDIVGLYVANIPMDPYEYKYAALYNSNTWERCTFSDQEVFRFQYNSNSKEFEALPFSNYPYTENGNVLTCIVDNMGQALGGNYPSLISNNNQVLKVYLTLNDLKAGSIGIQPYYISNKYQTFNNSSSNYTVDSSNSNNITYGDVNNYINDSYNTNGNYPTDTDIQVYIDNNNPNITPTPIPTPTTTPDNPSGGGTVSGNINNGGTASASATANNSGVNVTVNNNHNINFNVPGLSGNGIGSGTVSGNGNGSGGIFDWISDIGGVIGDFIKNVGQLIADVIKGITETITTVLADIPNIISVLVEFVYGGLPDELKAIVTLGITTVIFVGVIKMMRK